MSDNSVGVDAMPSRRMRKAGKKTSRATRKVTATYPRPMATNITGATATIGVARRMTATGTIRSPIHLARVASTAQPTASRIPRRNPPKVSFRVICRLCPTALRAAAPSSPLKRYRVTSSGVLAIVSSIPAASRPTHHRASRRTAEPSTPVRFTHNLVSGLPGPATRPPDHRSRRLPSKERIR